MKSFYSLAFFSTFANQELTDYFFATANKVGETEVQSKFLNHGFPVDLLLKHNANACLKDKRGHTAMMGAIC